MSDFRTIDDTYVAHTYARFPVEIVSGSGSVYTDANGKKYIDMGSGIAVSSFGISDDEWKEAVTAQLQKLTHTSNLYYTEPCAMLAKELCEKSGMKKVFFGNSGAEANECAIKAARKYAAEKKGSEYYTIVTLKGSFHGRTLTTLAATGQEHYHELFRPLTPGFAYADGNDIEDIKKKALEEKAAAVMIETIQGEGGVKPVPAEVIKELAAFCSENDILLIVDEVQTGNGRTGKMYSYMHFGIMPDIVSTAKGLGGGLPIGACLLGEKVENVFAPGDHGSTFGGNPVVCAGALSIVRRLGEGFLSEVTEKGNFIMDTFRGAKGVKSVSGLGLMVGIEPEGDLKTIMNTLIDRGVLALTAKDRLRLLPALNIPADQLKEACGIILEVLAEASDV